MDAHKINIKLFVEDASFLTQSEFVPVFHCWIQKQQAPDHVLIDVADYAHVQDGPGTVLVGHEANFYADRMGGRLGLTYSRKQPGGASFSERFRQALAAAFHAAARLESDERLEGRIRFKTDEFLVALNDRLHAPNTAETFRQVEPFLRRVISELYDTQELRLEHLLSERELFQVRVHVSAAPALAELLTRLQVPAPSR